MNDNLSKKLLKFEKICSKIVKDFTNIQNQGDVLKSINLQSNFIVKDNQQHRLNQQTTQFQIFEYQLDEKTTATNSIPHKNYDFFIKPFLKIKQSIQEAYQPPKNRICSQGFSNARQNQHVKAKSYNTDFFMTLQQSTNSQKEDFHSYQENSFIQKQKQDFYQKLKNLKLKPKLQKRKDFFKAQSDDNKHQDNNYQNLIFKLMAPKKQKQNKIKSYQEDQK